jgi:hypothetical protein
MFWDEEKNSYALYTRAAGAYVQALHLTSDVVNIFLLPQHENDIILSKCKWQGASTYSSKIYIYIYIYILFASPSTLYKQSIGIYASYWYY